VGVTLADGGRSDAKIYVANDAPQLVQEAANELSQVLKKMSGADVPVAQAAGAKEIDRARPGVALGALAEELGLKMDKTSRARDGFRYRVDGQLLLVVGESDRGVYHGVYDFLETLGCGWYAEGEIGEVIPKRETVVAPEGLDHSEVSDGIHRRFWLGGKLTGESVNRWGLRNKGHLLRGSWAHAYFGLVSPDKWMKDHPEYFSMSGGQRRAKQLCTTNPDVVRIAADTLMGRMEKEQQFVFAAGPNDGGGLCECPECAKLDTPGYLEPSSGKPVGSDRIFKFACDVAEITSKKYPDRDLGVLIYSEYSRIPAKLDRLHPNVFPMFAPIRRCRLHGPGNPICPWNMLWKEEIQGWGKLTRKMGFYNYNYNLADSLLPFSKISYYKDVVREAHALDVQELAWEFETIDSWAMGAPHFYLTVRLAWHSNIDIDKTMDEFFSGLYGEAAEPMRQYWLRIDKAIATTNTHTGSMYGLHHIWTDELLATSRKDIEEAKRLARSDRVKETVAMAEAGLKSAELFMRIWRGIGQCDFEAAWKAHEELDAHTTMMEQKPAPHWAHKRYAWGYYDRFVGQTVRGGADVVKNGGRILVKLPDVWKFRKDAETAGAQQGWFKPEHDDAQWEDFGTFSKSWDDQGLGMYQGEGWYRTRFRMPDAPAEERNAVNLWFGGFDNNVDVYLNGAHLGEKTGFARPATFENVGQHLKFGADNVLAVRVAAGGLSEMGTGGIMMPVMIYRAAGQAAGDKPKEGKGTGYEM
jgi:hypothetical protein